MRIETTILGNLLINEEYTRKVLPFLKNDYFTSNAEKTIHETIGDFVTKYNSLHDNIINFSKNGGYNVKRLKEFLKV